MVNLNLFGTLRGLLSGADTTNEAGGRAYTLTPRHALAQLAATGCFNGTYYTQAEQQLDALCALAEQVTDNVFLAKLALYSRERAYLKDMPAALLLMLSRRDPVLFRRVFARVVDNGRLLRTLFQMLRSGRFGRKGLSYALQRAFQTWLNQAGVGTLLSASIGNDPSLRDVLRLARPTPPDNARRALFGFLTGRPVEAWAPATEADLPADAAALVAFRRAQMEDEQVALVERARLRWDLLADSARGPRVWKAIARRMGAQALRMNLNTLLRHDVFTDDAEMIAFVADRIADADEIRRSRQFPYQYLAAYLNAEAAQHAPIKEALGRAAEAACGNVPELPEPVVIGVDVSGSMGSPVTGARGRGATSKMRCVDVAALFAAALVRRNPGSVVIPFDTQAYRIEVRADEPILDLAARLARYGGGGTDCALPLAEANGAYGDRRFAGCVLVSDMESWVGAGSGGATGVLTQWERFAANQRRLHGTGWTGPKLGCINVQAYTTTQAPERLDVLNIGGFSDGVFGVVAGFLTDDGERFVREVEAIEL
jgi:60 kDa SS-A/Ro ribonucleoprotein